MNLNLQKTSEGVRIALTGDLTGPEAAAFADAFKAEVPEGSVVTVDFSSTSAVDIEGLRKLITVDRWLKGRGGRLILTGVNGEVLNLLKANGVQSMFEIHAGGGAPAAAAPPVASAWETPAPAPAPVSPPPVAAPPRAAAPPVTPLPEEPSAWSREATPAAPPPRRAPDPAPLPASGWEQPAPPPARSAAPTPPPPVAPEADAWTTPVPAPTAPPLPPAAAADAWSAPQPAASPPPVLEVPNLPDSNSAWSTPGAAAPAGKTRAPKDPNAKSGAGLWIGLAALLAVGGGGAGWWFFLRKGEPPAITAVNPTGEITLEPGTLPDFKISAANAETITVDGGVLPGLTFKSSPYQGAVTGFYTGTVEPGSGQPVTLTFTANRGDLRSESRSVTFHVNTPVVFEQAIFFPTAGEVFDGRIVSGAESCTVDPKPDWLELTSESSNGRKVWSLKGTPPGPDKHQLKVTATGASGKPEQQVISLSVSSPAVAVVTPVDPPHEVPTPPDVNPTPPDVTPTPPTPTPTPNPRETADTPPAPAPKVPAALRAMIRDRMDHMSTSRLPQEMRMKINEGLDQVEQAAIICSVGFPTGGNDLSDAAKQQLNAALEKHSALLGAKNHQVIVIGYASPSGDAAKNLVLSRNRADSVSTFLEERGFRPRLSDGYGETTVVSKRDTANQAVEVYVIVPDENYVDPLDQLADQMRNLKTLMVAEEAK